jgi:hypothetical protein
VANYVPRPSIQQKIEEQLRRREDGHEESRTLVVYGLGGSGKSQLVLNHIRECRQYYSVVFRIEAEQKESIERDYIQIYRPPFGRGGSESVRFEEAVPAGKNWVHQHIE